MASNLQNRGIIFSPTIAQDFEVNYALKLPEFSTEFATAYDAKPRGPQGERVEYYALVFNKFFPADLDKINTYKNIKDRHLQEMYDFGRVTTARGEALCCIMKKPVGLKLSEVLKRNGAMEENFVTSQIFSQIYAALTVLHGANIMHGNINLETVYFNPQTAQILLRESISEFVGYSQKLVSETYERMVTQPAAKSPREQSADYYALGVLLVSLMLGRPVFNNIEDDQVRKLKFETGSFDAILGLSVTKTSTGMSPKTETLVRGLLHDKIKDRWQVRQITGWQKKEITMPPPSRVHKQSAIPFTFMDIDFYSPKYLAHIIQQNWAYAKKNLKLSELARWISFTSRLPDIEKRMASMLRGDQAEIILPDEKIARVIYLLDEDGPIRYKDVSFHPDGLGALLAYYMYKNDQVGVENLTSAIEMGLIEGWISGQDNQEIYKSAAMGWNPRAIKAYLRRNELGFGIERILYELNPYLPCLSPVLENTYSVGLPAVLTALNQGRLSGKDIDNDKHLTSYIAFQIDLMDTIKIKQLQYYPYFSKAMQIKLCAMFAMAQQRSGIDNLSGIANWLRQSLVPVTEKLNSVNIRKKLVQALDVAAATGDINKIFAVITDSRTIRKDVNGFAEAKKTFKILTFEILKLRNQNNLDQMAYRMGLRVAVITSYLISAIAILSLVFLNF